MIALTLVFFYKLAFTNQILARGDTFAYFYPYWQARNAAFLSGHLPLWSPDLFMGVPLLANSQIGTFYPPNWLVAPLSPPDGIRLSILLHVAWASIGVYLLARRSLSVSPLAALTAAGIFAFGGHIGAHVEQINQLQGLAWLPWLIYLLDRALERPLPNLLLLAMALALQFFTGHTQTVFISGVGLAIYALCRRPVRGLITLAGAGAMALLLAIPQLWPTLEMTGVSNRRGGLNPNQATAFSFSPFVTGRGLLPSYDSLIFAEYVAYPGVIGLGLAIIGVMSGWAHDRAPLQKRRFPFSPRVTWLIIALVGLVLAYGLYNPLYWLLATLPGFDLFRVPARWLALFALGAAMLAALGVEWVKSAAESVGAQRAEPLQRDPIDPVGTHLRVRPEKPGRHIGLPLQSSRYLGGSMRLYLPILLILGGLAAANVLTMHQPDLTPVSLPTPVTLIGWAAALIVLLIGLWRRWPLLLAGAALIELWIAAQIMPYNQLVPPEAYSSQEFTVSQMLAYNEGKTPPGRVLSISNLYFDPGNKAALDARYADLSPEARALAFDAVKMKDTLAANLPLIWDIPTVDGYDGGLLPTEYYTAFTSLFLPKGQLRTIDGRLREILAQPECSGACIPDQRWLDLMGVRYLITDKVYDLVNDGIFYDTTFPVGSGADYLNDARFTANAVDVLCQPCTDLRVTFGDTDLGAGGDPVKVGDYTRLRFSVDAPAAPLTIRLRAAPDAVIRAMTLVDTRTDDFQQLAPEPWLRVLSSDIKLYGNVHAFPRAVFFTDARFVLDSDLGTEDALKLMRDSAFDPAQTVILSGQGDRPVGAQRAVPLHDAQITDYSATHVSINVDTPTPGYLMLTDADYPGWQATVNGQPTPIRRADVMFRAVNVPAGQSTVMFEYRPAWLPLALVLGGAGWLITLAALALLKWSKLS